MHKSVTAQIGGKSYVCQIHREDLRFFEALHGSALNLFKIISAGGWRDDDIRKVIKFATGTRPAADDIPQFYAMRNTIDAIRPPKPTFLDEAIVAKGVGTYAPLAMAILAACLFGATDEEASFTDDPADG